MKECTSGYYCPSGTSKFNKTELFETGNMRNCPNGFFCPKGTADYWSISGNFTTP